MPADVDMLGAAQLNDINVASWVTIVVAARKNIIIRTDTEEEEDEGEEDGGIDSVPEDGGGDGRDELPFIPIMVPRFVCDGGGCCRSVVVPSDMVLGCETLESFVILVAKPRNLNSCELYDTPKAEQG